MRFRCDEMASEGDEGTGPSRPWARGAIESNHDISASFVT
jgi:hypothetical protein